MVQTRTGQAPVDCSLQRWTVPYDYRRARSAMTARTFEQHGMAAPRISLRPIATPLPIGMLALAVGSLVLCGIQLKWIPIEQTQTVALCLLGFVVPLQFIGFIFGLLSRDEGAASAMGLLFAAWLASGVSMLASIPAERRSGPAARRSGRRPARPGRRRAVDQAADQPGDPGRRGSVPAHRHLRARPGSELADRSRHRRSRRRRAGLVRRSRLRARGRPTTPDLPDVAAQRPVQPVPDVNLGPAGPGHSRRRGPLAALTVQRWIVTVVVPIRTQPNSHAIIGPGTCTHPCEPCRRYLGLPYGNFCHDESCSPYAPS